MGLLDGRADNIKGDALSQNASCAHYLLAVRETSMGFPEAVFQRFTGHPRAADDMPTGYIWCLHGVLKICQWGSR